MTIWCLIPNLVLYFLASLFYLLFRFVNIAYLCTLFGALLEAIYLGFLVYQKIFSPFGFISLGLVTFFLWLGGKGRWQALGSLFVPLSFIFFLLSLETSTKLFLLEKLNGLVAFHVALALLALLFLLGNFCLGLAFFIHERNLKRKQFNSFTMNLPPLLLSEKRATLSLRIGFVLLTLVLISGAGLVLEEPQISSTKFIHVALALLAWGVYADALHRRWMAPKGWKILLLSIVGFVSLTSAYLWT